MMNIHTHLCVACQLSRMLVHTDTVGCAAVCWRGNAPNVLLQRTRRTAEWPERSKTYHRDVLTTVISLNHRAAVSCAFNVEYLYAS